WRRGKIAELKDEALFKQEYPSTAAEAFQQSGHDSYIPPALVAKARKATCAASGPLVIGFDPAWIGEDRHAMAWRRGRRVEKVERRRRRRHPRPARRDGLRGNRARGELRLGAARAAAARRAWRALRRPSQPARRDVDAVAGVAGGSRR